MTALLKILIILLCASPGDDLILEFGNIAYHLGLLIWICGSTLICITTKKYWGKKSVEWFERLLLKICPYFEAIHQKEVGGDKPKLNLLFVGSSNGGKKSIIKSIMNKDCIDDLLEAPGMKHAQNKDAFGREVYAVKCPGFQQTEPENYKTISDIDNFKNAHKTIKHFDAIVFCIPYAIRLRKEEIDYIEMMKEVLGPSELRNKFILAMTRAEDCDKVKHELGLENIFDLLMNFGRVEIKNLLQECNNRCVLFNNKTKDKKFIKKQAVDFYEIVENVKAFHKENEDENGNTVRSPLSDEVYKENDYTESESLTVEAALNQSYSESSAEPIAAAITPAECEDDVQNNVQESNELIKRLDIDLQEGPGIGSDGSQRPEFERRETFEDALVPDSKDFESKPFISAENDISIDTNELPNVILKTAKWGSGVLEGKKSVIDEDVAIVKEKQPSIASGDSLGNTSPRHHVTFKTLGHQQFDTLRPFYGTLKENIQTADFTDKMFQKGVISFEEKIDIDKIALSNERKDAFFNAICRNCDKGSVDIFLKILQEKYTSLYEVWITLHGQKYNSFAGHEYHI